MTKEFSFTAGRTWWSLLFCHRRDFRLLWLDGALMASAQDYAEANMHVYVTQRIVQPEASWEICEGVCLIRWAWSYSVALSTNYTKDLSVIIRTTTRLIGIKLLLIIVRRTWVTIRKCEFRFATFYQISNNSIIIIQHWYIFRFVLQSE